MSNKHLFAKIFMVFILVLSCLSKGANAQSDSSGISGYRSFTPSGILDTAIDRIGNKYALQTIAVNDTVRADTSGIITCNTVDVTNKGFEFNGFPANFTTWRYNNMGSHQYGMYITAGYIGPQGTTTVPCDNIWGGACSTALATGYYHTFNAGTSPVISSIIYARANTTQIFDPWANGGGGGIYIYGGSYGTPCSYWFDGTDLINVTTPPSYSNCAPTYSSFPTGSLFSPLVGGGDTIVNGGGERSTIGGVNIRAGKRWIGQMIAWQAIHTDTTITDSSAMMRAFKYLATHSRYAWLTTIADNIANSNYDAARSLLAYNIDSLINTTADTTTGVVMADGTGADYVVQNYLDVYRLFLKYTLDTLSSADSAEVTDLANLCPGTDGTIVYTARALYYNVFGTILTLDDACLSADTSYARQGQQPVQPIHNINEVGKAGQGYSLQPNPNDGNLCINQKITKNNPVKVQIWNATGIVVLSSTFEFVNGKVNIKIPNAIPGLYLLQLSDNAGNTFIRKFVVQ